MNDLPTRRLTRSRNERIIGGVASGLATYLRLDPLVVRLIFLVVSLINGIGLGLYIGLWLLVPVEDSTASDARGQVRENLAEMQAAAQRVADHVRGMIRRS